jgi:alpha-beta hydrolase superfamily lysophospholipase
MAKHEEGFFNAKDNLRLFWESDIPDNPKAHVAVVHGYADHCGRYRKVIEALVKDGFAVHAFDYRGHGQADGRRGHCDAFSEYVDDLDLFWARVRKAANGKKSFVLAHSHGGLITLHWLQRKPENVAGIVFSAPYLKLAFAPPVPKVLAAKVVGGIVPWIPFSNPLKPEQLTRDPEAQKAVAKDPLYNQVVTPRWFNESNRAQDQALGFGNTVSAPVLFFCGSADPIASCPTTKKFFDTVASADKKFKEYPGMVHECMNDVGKEEVWKDISGWISAHV